MDIHNTDSTHKNTRRHDESHASIDLHDPIKAGLDAVNQKLCKPAFLKTITASRLPSQAASDSSISPEPTKTSFTSHVSRTVPSGLSHELIDFSSRVTRVEAAHPLVLDYLSHGSAARLTLNHTVCQELEKSFLSANSWTVAMGSERGFQSFTTGHQDLVLAVDFNYFGNRMVTASSDHNLKVWDRKDEAWSLVDSWKSHDAEVVDVKWNGPYAGEILGSIGEDGKFKLWQEDVTEMPNSHRRFKLIWVLISETKVPFMSLDFKNIFQDTYVALVTRDGHLSIWEPEDNNKLDQWKDMYKDYISPIPDRSRESSFRVSFHREKLPCWTAVMAGLDRKAVSLAVATQETIKIFRTDKNHRLYIAAEINTALKPDATEAKQLIRDIAWANGSMRGYDVIATAHKDGLIRVFELSTPESDSSGSRQINDTGPSDRAKSPRPHHARSNAPSGIGAGLADAGRPREAPREKHHLGQIKQTIEKVAELSGHQGAVWRVSFSPMGDLLVSTGDDGTIRTWKKAAGDQWLEYAEIEAGKDA